MHLLVVRGEHSEGGDGRRNSQEGSVGEAANLSLFQGLAGVLIFG
jgi:hypothetical protein